MVPAAPTRVGLAQRRRSPSLRRMAACRPLTASVAATALLRLGFATWFAVRPDDPARALGRPPSPGLRAVARVIVAREVVLGVGTLTALATGRRTAPWLRAMALADAVNGSSVAIAGLVKAVPPGRAAGLAAFDGSGTVTELLLARRTR